MSASILLFYSNKCQHCKQFLTELEQAGITSAHKVCIDSTPRERIPSVVTSVPALVFSGSSDSLQGERAFEWLKQQVHQRQQQAQRNQQSQLSTGGGGGGGGGGSNGVPGDPHAWQSTEMGSSFSDTYSFIDSSFTETGVGQKSAGNNGGSGSTIPKNFAFLAPPEPNYQKVSNAPPPRNGPSGYGRMPPSAGMAQPHQSADSADDISQRMEGIRMAREQDVPPPVQRVS
jgi:hypothetical protein